VLFKKGKSIKNRQGGIDSDVIYLDSC